MKATSPKVAVVAGDDDAGKAPGSDGAAGVALTGLEAIVLAQVSKGKGVTAYEVMKVLGRSPVGAVSASPGAVYPVVKRMLGRGLLTETGPSPGMRDGKGLSLTAAGQQALAAWAGSISADDAMPHDPMLSKVAAFGSLGKADRIKALFQARAAVDAKLDDVEAALADGGDVHARPSLLGAKALLRTRRTWLEGLLVEFAGD